jgi:ribose transport system permease protein
MTTQSAPIPSKLPLPSGRRGLAALAPILTLVVLFVLFSVASDSFLTRPNMNNLLVQISTIGILAAGLTFVLLTAQIDLSVAALMAIGGMIATQLFVDLGLPEPIPTLAALGIGTAMGFMSGLLSVYFRIPTFMTTLAMSLVAEGLTLWSSQGQSYYAVPPFADFLGSYWIGGNGTGVRLVIFIAAFVLLISHLVLRYTIFGRQVYMTGANPSAARLSGVNTGGIIILSLTICGFTAGLGGLTNIGRLGTALTAPEMSFLIDAIAVVVLGGTSLMGGRGGIPQTIVGLLIYGTLRNGLDNIPAIDPLTKDLITGLVLLVALVINVVFAGRPVRDKT